MRAQVLVAEFAQAAGHSYAVTMSSDLPNVTTFRTRQAAHLAAEKTVHGDGARPSRQRFEWLP